MSAPVRLACSFLDNRQFETTTTTFLAQADRYAFEEAFGLGSGVLAGMMELFDGDGKLRAGADGSALHDEWLGYFIWRALVRGVPELAQMSFVDWKQNVAEIEIGNKEDEDVDPTTPTPQPDPSLPSA